jgi:sarcosine oxidase subunit beta
MNQFAGDVIVIGGGIVGSSIALRLVEKGLSVILLEKGRVGEEASGRSAGGVRQQGRDPAELPLAMEAIKIWDNMKDELDCDVEYRRGGNLYYVNSAEKLEEFRKIAAKEKKMGLEVNILTPDETRAETPILSDNIKIYGAKYCPSDGTANPLLVTKAICRAAVSKGVQIRQYSPVRGLKVNRGKVISAVTDKGEYKGSVFVNAAGAWAKGLCNSVGIDIPILLIKARIMVTETLQPIAKQFIQTEKFYCRQALQGNLHIGGQIMRDPIKNNEKSVEFHDFVKLGRWLPAFFPITRNINIIRAFAGIIHSTPDEIPIIDKVPGFDNFFITTGFSGHGFCLGPIVGKLIAEWIVDGQSSMDLSAFNFSRFDRKGS